jgi:hypothetical protein
VPSLFFLLGTRALDFPILLTGKMCFYRFEVFLFSSFLMLVSEAKPIDGRRRNDVGVTLSELCFGLQPPCRPALRGTNDFEYLTSVVAAAGREEHNSQCDTVERVTPGIRFGETAG